VQIVPLLLRRPVHSCMVPSTSDTTLHADEQHGRGDRSYLVPAGRHGRVSGSRAVQPQDDAGRRRSTYGLKGELP
jgi:hypothetical protein